MNILEIKGEIGWDVTSREVINKLKDMSGDIIVEISSGGGSVYQGIEIFNALDAYDGKVTTVNVGIAASMASYIMLAGDTVKAYDNSSFMIHNALTYTYGNHHDLRKTANTLESLSEIIANKYVEKTGKTLNEIKQLMDDESFFYGSEMLDNGIADEIISTDKNKPKEVALVEVEANIQSCIASSKEHCKVEGYNKDFTDILATMPSERPAEKIVNKIQKDTNMVAKKDFDALQAKFDALKAEKDGIDGKLDAERQSYEAKIADAKNDSNTTAIIAFSGANRDNISFAKEEEFIKANTPLEEVMAYVRAKMSEDEAAKNLQAKEKEQEIIDSYILDAVANINGGNK